MYWASICGVLFDFNDSIHRMRVHLEKFRDKSLTKETHLETVEDVEIAFHLEEFGEEN